MKLSNILWLAVWAAIMTLSGDVLGQTTGTNLISSYNPGFESSLTDWGGAGFSNASIVTVNPGAGLKSAMLSFNTTNNWNVLVNTAGPVPTVAGNIYILSALTHQNLVGGSASLGLAELNSSQVTTQYTFETTSTSGAWHPEYVTLIPRTDTAYVRPYLWVAQAATSGAAYWDNLRIETLPNPFLTSTNASFQVLLPTVVLTYNGTSISPATLSPTIQVGNGFTGGVVAWKLVPESLGVNGTPVLQGAYAIQQSGTWSWPINMSQITPAGLGRYLLSITAVSADGTETETITKPVAVVNPPSTASPTVITSSTIDGNGRLSVNGQPFQAVMYYETTPAQYAVQRNTLGANSVQVTGNSVTALSASIDQAWAAGLYSWVVLFQPPFVTGSGSGLTWNIATLQSGINTLKSKPGVLGWDLCDEPDPQGITPSAVQAAYNAIKTADPNHVVWVNFTRDSLFKSYTGCSDFASYDTYPFPLGNLSIVNTENTDIKAAQPNKPLISVMDAYGEVGFPSFAQQRAELYTDVCDGMDHLFYFAWSMEPYYCLQNELEMQSYSQLLNWEMSQLQPFLYSTNPLAVTVSNPSVRAVAKLVSGNVIIVMVNQSSLPVTGVSVTVTGKTFTSSTAYFPGASAGTVSGGQLTDTLQPYGAGVYQMH